MPATKIADIIVPSLFHSYLQQRTTERSALIQSGIVVRTPELDDLALKGGKLINMPFFNDLTGDDEVLSDSSPLSVNKITSGQDIAVLLMRGRAWGNNDLATALSGADPFQAILNLVADYWVRQEQKVLLANLKGVFSAASMAANKLDISALVGDLAVMSPSTFVDALQKMGDAKEKLTGVMMHSATEASLLKQGLIEHEIKTINGEEIQISYYMKKRVIVDDACPVTGDVYTTYVFGEGAFGKGEGAAPTPTEIDRDSLAGEDILINRRHFIMHPRGVKFTSSSVAGASPTNAELGTAANWERVYDPKNIRVVEFKHKLK